MYIGHLEYNKNLSENFEPNRTVVVEAFLKAELDSE